MPAQSRVVMVHCHQQPHENEVVHAQVRSAVFPMVSRVLGAAADAVGVQKPGHGDCVRLVAGHSWEGFGGPKFEGPVIHKVDDVAWKARLWKQKLVHSSDKAQLQTHDTMMDQLASLGCCFQTEEQRIEREIDFFGTLIARVESSPACRHIKLSPLKDLVPRMNSIDCYRNVVNEIKRIESESDALKQLLLCWNRRQRHLKRNPQATEERAEAEKYESYISKVKKFITEAEAFKVKCHPAFDSLIKLENKLMFDLKKALEDSEAPICEHRDLYDAYNSLVDRFALHMKDIRCKKPTRANVATQQPQAL